MDARHPYEMIPLFTAGLLLGVWLVGSHALMLAKPALVQGWLKKFPRHNLSGQIILGIGLAWFWLLGRMGNTLAVWYCLKPPP